MAQRQSLIARLEVLALTLCVQGRAFAVWPPSTAFQANVPSLLFGLIVVAFVIGIVLGIWSQKNHHEHK